MVLRVPDGGDVGYEVIGVVRKSGLRYRVGLCSQKAGESLPIVNIQRAAFDAARIGAKLRRRKAARGYVRGDRFWRNLYKIPDRIERQIADRFRRTNPGQAA